MGFLRIRVSAKWRTQVGAHPLCYVILVDVDETGTIVECLNRQEKIDHHQPSDDIREIVAIHSTVQIN